MIAASPLTCESTSRDSVTLLTPICYVYRTLGPFWAWYYFTRAPARLCDVPLLLLVPFLTSCATATAPAYQCAFQALGRWLDVGLLFFSLLLWLETLFKKLQFSSKWWPHIDIKPNSCPTRARHGSACKISPPYVVHVSECIVVISLCMHLSGR